MRSFEEKQKEKDTCLVVEVTLEKDLQELLVRMVKEPEMPSEQEWLEDAMSTAQAVVGRMDSLLLETESGTSIEEDLEDS